MYTFVTIEFNLISCCLFYKIKLISFYFLHLSATDPLCIDREVLQKTFQPFDCIVSDAFIKISIDSSAGRTDKRKRMDFDMYCHCGWGGFCVFYSTQPSASRCTGTTLNGEQIENVKMDSKTLISDDNWRFLLKPYPATC